MKCRFDKNQIINILESQNSHSNKDEILEHIKNCPECRKIYSYFSSAKHFYEDESIKADKLLSSSISQAIDKDLYKNRNAGRRFISLLHQHPGAIKASACIAAALIVLYAGFSHGRVISDIIAASSIYRFLTDYPSDNIYMPEKTDTPIKTSTPFDSATPEPVITPTPVAENKNTVFENINELSVFSDLSSFSSLKDNFINTNIKTEENPDSNEVSGKIYDVKGSFDLNSDGKEDDIYCFLASSSERNLLEINDSTIEFYLDYPLGGKVNIADFDTRDNYKEILIFDKGPSGDPHYICFRYTGAEIVKLGSIPELSYLDGHGRIIFNWYLSSFCSPNILFGWQELKNGSLVFHPADISPALNKTYEASGSFEAYFDEMDSVPENYYPDWSQEKMVEFQKGEKITIKHINIGGDTMQYPLWYFVELENGKKGLLYFWPGD